MREFLTGAAKNPSEGPTGFVKVAGTGIELPPENAEKTPVGAESGAQSGAVGAREAVLAVPVDPNLAAVVDAWPTLPEAIKVGILAMIRAAR